MAKKLSDSNLALLTPRSANVLESPNQLKSRHQPSREKLELRCKRADKQAWIAAAKLAVKNGIVIADQRGTLAPWAVKTLNMAVQKAKEAKFSTSRTG